MTYDIHHRRYADSYSDRIVIYRGLLDIEAACARRDVSGDLVVHAGTDIVVQDEAWLWPWEKEDSECFARRAMRADAERARAKGLVP